MLISHLGYEIRGLISPKRIVLVESRARFECGLLVRFLLRSAGLRFNQQPIPEVLRLQMNLQNANSSTDQALGLLDLADDILSLIISLLLSREGSRSALAISLVCRRLRTISLFFLFRVVRWPREGRTEFYPHALWPYMRYVFYLKGFHDKAEVFL